MDWKKEIKLSDLVGRKRPPEAASGEKPVPFWKKEISFGRKPKPKAEPVELRPVADEDWVWVQLALAEEAAAAPPKPAEGIHPPVPAAELPPLPKEKKPKQSLLKREISFRRKRATPSTGARPVPGTDDPATEKAPKQSLLKREISFRRKPKAEA